MGIFDRMFGKKREAEQSPQSKNAPAAPGAPAAPAVPPDLSTGAATGRATSMSSGAAAAPSGERATQQEAPTAPASAPAAPPPRRLQVLFPQPPRLDGQAVVNALERMHPSMRPATLDVVESGPEASGTAKWGVHVIEILVRKHPLAQEMAERAIVPANYSPELMERARGHAAYLVLNYRGSDPSPWEQYVALAALAAVFTRQGAIAIANVDAYTFVPASVFDQLFQSPDPLAMLRGMPPALLYCGFIKYEAPGSPGVWMRTEGAPRLGLPDLAVHARAHTEGERTFNLFNSIINQARQSGATPTAGLTLQLGPAVSLRFRAPAPGEPLHDRDGPLLVIEQTSVGDQPAMATV